MLRAVILTTLLGASLVACTTKSPVLVDAPPFPLAVGPVHADLDDDEHRAGVERGLERAGIPIARSAADLAYMLEVEVGGAQTPDQGCGNLRNVRYKLFYAVVTERRSGSPQSENTPRPTTAGPNIAVGGQAVELVAKGYDGNCTGNVFDEMGAALRRQMGDG